jgi:CYTH domain-containing protein/8-oxo-dGTP pyrophosphatase MutT (NUDIX family)
MPTDDWPGDHDVVADAEVRASGGVIVRGGDGDEPEVALVHRPKYDDWSLPKGKLDDGEGWEEAALREVEEETGLRARLLDELSPIAYLDPKGRRKVVRYWRMEAATGTFTANKEVDEFEWLALGEALERLTYDHDRELVRAALAPPPSGVEIERKWLVAEVPDEELRDAPSDAIAQGYLATGRDGDAEVRVRRRGGRSFITVKSTGGLERVEEELEIDARTFASLWPLTEGRRVEKTRHLVPFGDATLEIDVYEGALDGLVVAEVEFGSRRDSAAFTPPTWVGEDVTEDERYKARNLALHGVPSR